VRGVYYIEILGSNSTTTTKSMLSSLLPSVMVLYPERLATFDTKVKERRQNKYNTT
jgi:UDP-N-acetylmuramyl pentapeptide synthase